MNETKEIECPQIGINVGITANGRTLSVAGINGSAPYTYSLNGSTYQSSGSFSNLSPNNYEIWAKDSNGCIGTKMVNLPPPQGNTCPNIIINVGVTPLTGTIGVQGKNGEEPYQYSIDNINYNSSGIFENLQPGTYTIWTLDKNQCPCTKNIELPPAS
jgi:hypothetical protein